MGKFGHPVVPMAVHEVLGDIGLGLVKVGIYVLGGLHVRRDVAYVHDLAFVGRVAELPYSVLNVGELLAGSERS